MLLGERTVACTFLALSVSFALLSSTAVAQQRQQSPFITAKQSKPVDGSYSLKNSPWFLSCLDSNGADGASEDCTKLLREEHRVGALPWEAGHEPISESFAGHIPIRSWQQDGYHGETSMFYWYFPAVKPKVKDPPLLIWLQGGPGSSSMIGLFFENGPVRVNANMKLERQPVHWADEYSVLFIDQPVGTGYSYVTQLQDSDNRQVTDPETIRQILATLDNELQTDQLREQDLFKSITEGDLAFKSGVSRKDKIKTGAPLYSNGYVKDERGVASDLLLFLDEFYQRYPELQNVDLYLTGESYAGKYVPAFAYGIMESNNGRRHHHEDEGDQMNGHATAPGLIFPLKGIALGNSLTDPVSQIQIHADHAYYMGLITGKQADQMRVLQDQSSEEAQKGRFLESNRHRLEVFDLFKNATGGLNWYDIRKGQVPNDWSRMEAFMNLKGVKDALNVFGPRTAFLKEQGVPRNEIRRIQAGRANTKYNKDPLVIKAMGGDIMKSATWMVSNLLQQGIKVLAYQGIFDFRDAVAGSNVWIDHLDWPGQKDFLDAERTLWMNEGQLAGYVTQVPGLTRVAILGAGHLAPMDQAESTLAMIRSFVEGSQMDQESLEASRERAPAHIM